MVPPSEHFTCRVQFSSLGGGNFLPPSEPISSPVHISAHCPSGGLQFIFRRGIQSGSNEKQIEKFLNFHFDFALDENWCILLNDKKSGMLRVSPWDGDCDASFAARLRRKILPEDALPLQR